VLFLFPVNEPFLLSVLCVAAQHLMRAGRIGVWLSSLNEVEWISIVGWLCGRCPK
jgi:hypothetical protein